MSPELNANPPVLIKRKKNRERKHASASKINDFNTPSYNYFQSNLNSYPNIAMNDNYYPFRSYQMPPEPLSLPIYPPNYQQNMQIPVNFTYPIPKPQTETNEYLSLPVFTQNDNSDQRRFSDPGLPNESDSSCASSDSLVIQKLTQQVGILRDNNRKLNREVSELRMELNILKQQHHARHYEREYEPGIISDIIREIRDAARVREDTLLAKVRHMVEEKQMNMGQFHLSTEKNRNNERLSKLEEQMKSLSVNNSRSEDSLNFPSTSVHDDTSGSARQVLDLERETLHLRRELQDARARKEESDNKCIQLDKKLSSLLRPKDLTSENSDDGKTSTISTDTISQSSMISTPHRITLSGPVTDL